MKSKGTIKEVLLSLSAEQAVELLLFIYKDWKNKQILYYSHEAYKEIREEIQQYQKFNLIRDVKLGQKWEGVR